MKDFKIECKWKWKYDKDEDKLHAKRNDNEHDLCEKDETNLRRKELKCSCKQR